MKTLRLFLILLPLLVTGCAGIGPTAVQHSRTDYNLVLRRTSDEQLLLNLVRLRYRDRPLFLEVSGLTTQFKFSPFFSASLYDGSDGASSTTIKGEVEYEERPTVTYAPLQGKDFVQRVLSPVSWRTLDLLDNVGWRSDRVLRVCVQQMNHLGNAITASGPTPERAPPFRAFLRAVSLYRTLKERDLVHSFAMKEGGQVIQMLDFVPEATETPEYREFTRLLGLDPEKRRYPVLLNAGVRLPDTIDVRTRSFIGILSFLSHAVEVPDEDLAAGRVTRTLDDAGRPFDWSEVTRGLMRIRSSSQEPDNASVKVHYRGHWFYIDDSDLDSKSTFMLLGQLFALQSGEVRNTGPVLTLPVN